MGATTLLSIFAAGGVHRVLAEPPTVGAGAPSAIGLPEQLPFEPLVKDPVFSALVGLVRSDIYGTLTRERLEKELARRAGRSRLPYQKLRELTRLPDDPGRTARVTLVLKGDLRLPIPYTILWYHPGSFATSQTCTFREWIMGPVSVPCPAAGGAGSGTTVDLQDVHLFALQRGRLEVDIDGWLDRLLGAALDDTSVTGVLLFKRQGNWLAMAVGYDNQGRGRSGTFDLAGDRILFPVPGEMKAVARQMRSQMESLVAAGHGLAPGDGSVR